MGIEAHVFRRLCGFFLNEAGEREWIRLRRSPADKAYVNELLRQLANAGVRRAAFRAGTPLPPIENEPFPIPSFRAFRRRLNALADCGRDSADPERGRVRMMMRLADDQAHWFGLDIRVPRHGREDVEIELERESTQ
jgi:hypothetical protein